MNHDQLTINLKSTQCHVGFIVGSPWDHFGIILGSSYDHFEIILGSLRRYPDPNLINFKNQQKIN